MIILIKTDDMISNRAKEYTRLWKGLLISCTLANYEAVKSILAS